MRCLLTSLHRVLFILVLTLTQASCGFHLRGFIEMPKWINNIAIVLQHAHRDLGPLLKKQLEAYHIRVLEDPLAASYVIIIEHDDVEKNIVSISSSTTPRQYQLTYTVQFIVQDAQDKIVLPSSKVISTRQITINSDRILGSTDEEEKFKREMREEAALQIINRLSRMPEGITKQQ